MVRLNKKKSEESLTEENSFMRRQFVCLVKMIDEEIPDKYKAALELRILSQKYPQTAPASPYSSERFQTTLKTFMGIKWKEGKSLKKTNRVLIVNNEHDQNLIYTFYGVT